MYRDHKDIALISLANVLHRAHYSLEAAIVVHASIDVSKELNVNHFTLGNIYAVSINRPCGIIKTGPFLYPGYECSILVFSDNS